ncbi:MAG TPA: hypothetical protein DIV86_05135 [Alphaproteobacteria bacterium]|nr:hypothetical protein [Alphaproteobacteria bacterium]
MFGFGKKRPESYKDAKNIISSINEEAIRSAWDIYVRIKKNNHEKYGSYDETIFNQLKNSYEALKKVLEKDGDFQKFTDKEKHFLLALRDGHLVYSDIIHVLIDNHDNEKEAEYLYEQHPRLHKIIPKQYDNSRQVIEVLLEYVKQFQWHLEQYSMTHYGKIEKSLGEAYDDEQVYVSRG